MANAKKSDTLTRLRAAVIEKRRIDGRSMRPLREVAAEVGVSMGTLSRFELGGDIDVASFDAMLKWVGGEVRI